MKISPSGQIRIPKEIMERLHINTGDYIDFEYKKNVVLLKAKKLIDADQAWFWEKDWQEAELKAEEDIRAGNVSNIFKTPEDGMKHLKRKRKTIINQNK